jgi:hypothetical protein
MLDAASVDREVVAYRLKLLALGDRFAAGERSTVRVKALTCADALTCLLEEAPLEQREAVDYLVDRYEALGASCLS